MRVWVGYIEHNSISTSQAMKPFDNARSIQWLDFDLICQLCFEHGLGFISNHSDRYDFQKTLDERLSIVEQIGVLAEFGSILRFISRVTFLNQVLPSAKDKSGVGKILGTNACYMPRKDLLAAWLDRGMESDTTATAIRGVLLYIITSPPVYTRLISEKNQSQSELASYATSRYLPYLHACIEEGLRLFPPVAALHQRGDILGGNHVPGGVVIRVNIRGLFRHEAFFGTDADIFRPERCLETTQPQLRQMK
ncbi:putative benzoate 4-monooxygenase cytochrome p450 protein [Botrytis fragariae]|uniref:Putative benzoate 4-monooxygenase cytochrome p450 protein n=1 Tax=Botrytis fragariae TaxID=1964551 RepID=A0A8H6ENX7_9HELO|nr:putative benzoate 4-monooxygenase cytochrome p450 protein [Botrytis fragariae]KAF5878865.1 putative benzoate 4-monooxygenase cytochrome p450 protein [Botrytis fragariae]